MATQKIKEKLVSDLNSEKIIFFLKNTLNNNGFGLSNAPQNVNRFLDELTESNNIKIIEKGNIKKVINDIEFYNKKILVRTSTTKYCNHICFDSFKYEREDKINFKEVMYKINRKLDFHDYIFLIRIDEEYKEKKSKIFLSLLFISN